MSNFEIATRSLLETGISTEELAKAFTQIVNTVEKEQRAKEAENRRKQEEEERKRKEAERRRPYNEYAKKLRALIRDNPETYTAAAALGTVLKLENDLHENRLQPLDIYEIRFEYLKDILDALDTIHDYSVFSTTYSSLKELFKEIRGSEPVGSEKPRNQPDGEYHYKGGKKTDRDIISAFIRTL